jgi:glycosyltransferase involved in cell wall biosynthesis
MKQATWHILTGEYAPAPGGVANYTQVIARGLAAAGDEVNVWSPPYEGRLATDLGVRVHALPEGYGPFGLAQLARAFRRYDYPVRVLVQYVPHAFGLKAMNLPFALWVRSFGRNAQVWVMFHEVAVDATGSRSWKQSSIAAINRMMARQLVRRADRVLVSIPRCADTLRSIVPNWSGVATWLPVPSNVATSVCAESASTARARLNLSSDTQLVGHFGSYGPLLAPLLLSVLGPLLQTDRRRRALLLGHSSEPFARTLEMSYGVAGQVLRTGFLPSAEIAACLAACDIVVQPYGDGISTRRTSAMAALALGVPIVSNEGSSTEPLWRQFRAIALADSMADMVGAAERILRDPCEASQLRSRAASLYREHFAIERILASLRDER